MDTLVITSNPRLDYAQWFLLGFYEMERKGEIKLKIELPPLQRFGFSSNSCLTDRFFWTTNAKQHRHVTQTNTGYLKPNGGG